MRRRVLAVTAVVLSSLAAACRDVAPPSAPQASSSPVASTLGSNVEWTVEGLIVALFEGANEQSALSMWTNIQKELASQTVNQSSLTAQVNNLVKFTLEHLAVGDLQDPDGAGILNPTTGAMKMLSMVFAATGVFPTIAPVAPSGTDAIFAFVDPNATENQTFITSFGDAAAAIPPGSFTEPVLLVVVRQPPEVQVNTPYQQLSRTFDVAIAPEVPFVSISVLMCPFPGLDHVVNSRAVIAHQKSLEEVEYLNPSTIGNLTCPEDVASAWREQKGFVRQRAAQAASYASAAWKLFAPKPLYAGHAAIGGVLPELSPAVAVDPYVTTGIDVAPIAATTYGQAVEVSATLKRTGGPAALVGSAVPSMQMTAQVDGGTPVAATADANGVATWQFTRTGAGSHTVSFAFAGFADPANAPVYGPSSASAAFTVNLAPLTLTANDAARLYGEPNPTFTGSIVGTQYDDALTLDFSTDATVTSMPGQYDIIPTVSGAALVNYFVVQPVTNGTLTINKIPLTVSMVGGSYVFGQDACAVQYSATPIVPLTGTVQCMVGSLVLANPAPVGTYLVTPSGLTSNIYDITFQAATISVKYNTQVGHVFISPVPNTQFNQGRNIPVKFQLFMADGVTPIRNAVATVEMPGVPIPPDQTSFSYGGQVYHVSISLPNNQPIGQYTIIAHLDDGSRITTTVFVKGN